MASMAVFRGPSSRGQPPWHRHYKLELLGKKHIPIESVVPDLSRIVENASLSGLDQLLQGSASLGQEVVKIIYITTDHADPQKTTSDGAYRSDSRWFQQKWMAPERRGHREAQGEHTFERSSL